MRRAVQTIGLEQQPLLRHCARCLQHAAASVRSLMLLPRRVLLRRCRLAVVMALCATRRVCEQAAGTLQQ